MIDQIPRPPVAELIPHGPVMPFGLFNLTMMVLAFVYLAWQAWRGRSVLPLPIPANNSVTYVAMRSSATCDQPP
jgi:hypothetical protein